MSGKVKLQDCKETDREKREVQFAFRSTDLQIWKKYFASRNDSEFTNNDPVITQHWSLVVYFPHSKKMNFFEAVEDKSGEEEASAQVKGILQPLRAENVDDEVFEKAEYFGTVETSPAELLEIANQVSSNFSKYDGLYNNCQSWVKEFVGRISQNLLDSLIEKLSSSNLTGDVNLFLTKIMQNTVTNSFKIVKLDECDEEFDQTKREAQFAFQISGDESSQQQWALVVHFSRGKKTYLFGAWKDENDLLQAGRAEGVDYKIFQTATHFGQIASTSPDELLKTAQRVPSNGTAYDATSNDSQSWLHEFLTLISPELLSSLFEKMSSSPSH